jgi:hypothetical protein
MIISFFNVSAGGFMIHKAKSTVNGSRLSAWYDKDGNLTAYERIDSRFVSFSKINKADMKHLISLGKVYFKNNS